MSKHKKKNSIKNIIKNHILNNAKDYIIVAIIFFIGIIIGVIYINNISDEPKLQIEEYINGFISSLKESKSVDSISMIKNLVLKNMIFIITLWFVGSTVIGIPLVYAFVAYRGFCIGYTISSCIAVLGSLKGALFVFTSVFLQNIIYIPAILALAVSGIKLYKSIMKDRRKENIKLEIYRHILFSIIVGMVFMLGCFIEVYASTNLLIMTIDYL